MGAGIPFLLAAIAVIGLCDNAAAQETTLEQEYRELLKERDRLSRTTRILRDESALLVTRRPYLVVDLGSKQLTLKVRGLAVKQVTAVEVRQLGGTRCTSGTAVLEKFEAPRAPKAPAADASGTEKTVAVSDMPQTYQLGFVAGDRSVNLSVHPTPSTTVARAWLEISAALASGSRTIQWALGSRRASYRLLLAPEDAQALFWALEKGSSAILICD